MATYEELEFSWYQNKSLGRTRQQEDAMVCDCRYDPGAFLQLGYPPHTSG